MRTLALWLATFLALLLSALPSPATETSGELLELLRIENERIASASRRLSERIKSLQIQIDSFEKQIESLESSNRRQKAIDERRRKLLARQLESLQSQEKQLEGQRTRLTLLEERLTGSDSSSIDLKIELQRIRRGRWIERGVCALVILVLILIAAR